LTVLQLSPAQHKALTLFSPFLSSCIDVQFTMASADLLATLCVFKQDSLHLTLWTEFWNLYLFLLVSGVYGLSS